MAKKKSKKKTVKKKVETLTHEDAKRKNIPTAEYQSVMAKSDQSPIAVAYERRNQDLDPQLVWRGKYEQDQRNLIVQAPPLYIQEKVHPKVLVDDLRRQTEANDIAKQIASGEAGDIHEQFDLFADFNGIPDNAEAKTEFYHHDQHWSNRMILGDSLSVMGSLAEREGLRGKVQCIYLDPPYGIKFNSNFQWSTTSRDVKDGKADHITREPEQVKAFRDTWRDGIHSYLTYLRDRLTVARDLLHDTGSIFVQIGDENVHRVRAVMDEVFGDGNFASLITFQKTSGQSSPNAKTNVLTAVTDYILWYAKDSTKVKYREQFLAKGYGDESSGAYRFLQLPDGTRRTMTLEERSGAVQLPKDTYPFRYDNLTSAQTYTGASEPIKFEGGSYKPPGTRGWSTKREGLIRLMQGNRLFAVGKTLSYVRFIRDFPVIRQNNVWEDTGIAGFAANKQYVVETSPKVIQRCLLMATDPGDLVLDPTCGSGTTAYVAEQWGRRWITIDTSRVSLALARARIMGARYQYYLLADSREGAEKEAAVTRTDSPDDAYMRHFGHNVRQGFVYERVPHITLKSIANNTEIDVIWDKFQQRLEPLREQLNKALKKNWEEWEVPRDAGDPWKEPANEAFWDLRLEQQRDDKADADKISKHLKAINATLGTKFTLMDLPEKPVTPWKDDITKLHTRWWEQRIERQKEIDASIAAKADYEYLYDKPYEDKKKVRVAGPFTVESLSPHRTLAVDQDDELIDPLAAPSMTEGEADFAQMVIENLLTAGVQQVSKQDKINFSSLNPWPGHYIAAEGRYTEGDDDSGDEKRAGIFIGPEFGTVSRQDLVIAAREAGDADFDVLISCAFNYEAHASEFNKLGRIPVLKARMNADLHMADDLKNTGKGNLFVIFGEPDIEILPPLDASKDADVKDYDQIRVKINGVDVFHPQTGEVRSDGPDGIACWFIDTNYNEESFFVRHAYFLGANDPYKSLKTTLKAEINAEAWETLNSDTSREFPKPEGGRIAVKVINHLGDEVMKVFNVE